MREGRIGRLHHLCSNALHERSVYVGREDQKAFSVAQSEDRDLQPSRNFSTISLSSARIGRPSGAALLHHEARRRLSQPDGRGWPWCLATIAGAGTAINASFAARPTPRMADIANRLSLGMVLARLLPSHRQYNLLTTASA